MFKKLGAIKGTERCVPLGGTLRIVSTGSQRTNPLEPLLHLPGAFELEQGVLHGCKEMRLGSAHPEVITRLAGVPVVPHQAGQVYSDDPRTFRIRLIWRDEAGRS